MFRLVYISSSKVKVDRALLDNVLAVFRRNNSRRGVSGLLVSGGRRFLQALEGPEAAVRETYQRICADDRHRAFVILSEGEVAERAFGEWSMAYDDGSNEDLSAKIAALVEQIDDPNLRAQFTGFARLHGRAA